MCVSMHSCLYVHLLPFFTGYATRAYLSIETMHMDIHSEMSWHQALFPGLLKFEQMKNLQRRRRRRRATARKRRRWRRRTRERRKKKEGRKR